MPVVVALDVDGVLNHSTHPVRHDIVLPASILPKHNWMRGGGEQDLAGAILLDPSHGPMIRRWQKLGADVRWCTTWGEAANVVLSPLLGIGSLPVIPFWEGRDRHMDDDLGGFKAWYLNEDIPGPLVWIDDMVPFGWSSRQDSLGIGVGRAGLTASQKRRVSHFIKVHQ